MAKGYKKMPKYGSNTKTQRNYAIVETYYHTSDTMAEIGKVYNISKQRTCELIERYRKRIWEYHLHFPLESHLWLANRWDIQLSVDTVNQIISEYQQNKED